MSRLDDLRRRLHARKRNRDRKRRLKQGHRAKREARAVRKLRALVARLLSPRVQFDAVTLANVATDAPAVGCYVNGSYANEAEARERFPKARITTISVRSSEVADVLDVEVGDATPADCPAYYRRFKEARPHRRPIFYTFASQVQELIDTLAAAGISRDRYILWSAHWDAEHICSPSGCGYPRADATQWTTHDETVDESKCRPSYWDRG